MNILLEPDPQDPRCQFYDHPLDRGAEVDECLADLAAHGWEVDGKPWRVNIHGQTHLRFRMVPKSGD